MSGEGKKALPSPSAQQLREELARVRRQQKRRRSLLKTCLLLCVLGAAVIVLALAMPVLRIQGESMSPTLEPGDMVVLLRGDDAARGDLIAFEAEDKILVKRVIGLPGDQVDIAEDGTVSVNGQQLEETYLTQKAHGEADVQLPLTVPSGTYFVLGDQRLVSVDSRSTALGCISGSQLIGRIVLRIWPLSRMDTW